MPVPVQNAALQAVKRFRTKEFKGLLDYLRSFGPLPSPIISNPTSTTSSDTLTLTLPNPFIPWKHPKTGKWRTKYSLRQQAELLKHAKATNTLHLLPPSRKKSIVELRLRKLKESYPQQSIGEEISQVKKPQANTKPRWNEKEKQIRKLDRRLSEANAKLNSLQADLKPIFEDYHFAQLKAFKTEQTSSQIMSLERKRLEKMALENKIGKLEDEVALTEDLLSKAKEIEDVAEVEDVTPEPEYLVKWDVPVSWVGEVNQKLAAGSELGTRLYSGKKRMFKGHLWERKAPARAKKRVMLLRDMDARVVRYKEYYKKRRPNPLKPSRYTKQPKLPF